MGRIKQLGSVLDPVGASGGGWDLADRVSDMISTQALDGSYRYVSAAAGELLGYEPSELVGSRAYDLLHPRDVACAAAAQRSALRGAPFTSVHRLRHKHGFYVWVETRSRAVLDEESGETTELVCCTRPMVERAALDESGREERELCRERVLAALATEEVDIAYQPIAELRTERIVAYEALARFADEPRRGPERWFADAWRVGLGVPLEMLAVRAAAAALPCLPAETRLCVNASPPTVAAPGFQAGFGASADRVVVEVTEHLQIDDSGFHAQLAPLREAGGTVALDDFGAGFASLSHILTVRPDWIKLDVSLTERVADGGVAQALAASVTSFAETIGIEVVAEGVETAEQSAILAELGIRYGQGFHIGRPTPLGEALHTAP